MRARLQMAAKQRTRGGRRGGVSPLLILGLGVLLACVALAVDSANLWQAHVESRNAADAAVLAAAQALASDDALIAPRPGAFRLARERAVLAAQAYGQVNPVLGSPLLLEDNPENDPDGDVVFGYLEESASRYFHPAGDRDDPLANAVRVTARRTRERGNPAGTYFARLLGLPSADVVATATAFVDRDVYGFRPVGGQPIPFAPIALLSDPEAAHPLSWEAQIELPLLASGSTGDDAFQWDGALGRFLHVPTEVLHGDGIPEMSVRLPLAGQANASTSDVNGCFVFLGDAAWETLARQIALGVFASDLAENGGELALAENNLLLLPAASAAPGAASEEGRRLLAALNALQLAGEPRVWPLYRRVEANGAGESVAVVRGFVAGRLVRADVVEVAGNGKPSRVMLQLIIQPARMVTGTALTDAARRHLTPEVDLYNRYVAKVRLVE